MHEAKYYGRVNLQRKTEVRLKAALEDIPSICNKELRDYINRLVKSGLNARQLHAHFRSTDYRWNKQNVDKVEVWRFSDEKEPLVAIRESLDTSFDAKRIDTITDTGIQKILLNYLEAKGGDPAIAFTPEGIAEMNQNMALYNNGKMHQQIGRAHV